MKITYVYKIFFFINFLLFSCKKFIQIEPPINQVISSTVFTNEGSASSAVAGLYSQMMLSPLILTNGALSIYCGLSSDEIYNSTSSNDLDAFTNNAIVSSNSTIHQNFWASSYKNIYHANAILEGLTKSTNLSSSLKKQLEGEVRIVRALYYLYLVNSFGDVPLITNTDYESNARFSRSPASEIYQQIILDLKQAENQLSNAYPSNGRIRPNRLTAHALLARVYLYQKDWANAEIQSSIVINSGMYSLIPDLNKVFLANSNEVIWQLLPVINGYNTVEGFYFIPAAGVIPAYLITDYLLNAFESGDQRKNSWLGINVVNGRNYFYPYKYKTRSNQTIIENNIVLRLSEQFLIRAEARAFQNKINDGQTDLNMIRTRAGLGSMSVSTQAALLTAIEHERQVELFTEWGHRWFDLKRLNLADIILSAEKPGWQTTDALYPIPLAEIQRNPFLNQNPGY